MGEDQFRAWYGIDIKQLLALHQLGRVNIRILFPSGGTTIPNVLQPFFSGEFPSTARDLAFNKHLLGEAQFEDLRRRFERLIGKSLGDTSIDGFPDNTRRAFKTAQTAYVQLHALRHSAASDQFEMMWHHSPSDALRWLEVCRLFLIGPIHYSLNGIHCVSNAAPQIQAPAAGSALQFPAELERILVNALGLVRHDETQADFTFSDCLAMFPDFELARNALTKLDQALKSGDENQTISSADDLRQLIANARLKGRSWLKWMKIAAATGLGAVNMPLNPVIGLLSTLGFALFENLGSERVDRVLEPVARKLTPKSQQHLNLILELDDEARRHFKTAA